MGIREGTVTLSTQLFLPEVLSDKGSLDPEFVNLNDSLLSDGTIPNDGYHVTDLGTLDGRWSFWNRLHSVEKDTTFHYSPLYLATSLDCQLSRWFTGEFSSDDYKINVRVLYYPFGLLVTRLRVYFRFDDEVSVEEFVRFRKQLSEQIQARSQATRYGRGLCGRDDNLLKVVNEQVLTEVFRDVPDTHWGRLGNLNPYVVTYLYEASGLGSDERAKLLKGDPRPLSDHIVEEMTGDGFGQLKDDTLVVDRTDALLHTPYFSTISPRNRRWKRIQLLNNIYLATELARYEHDYATTIQNQLKRTLDALNDGTITGVPLRPRYLVAMRESLSLGNRLRGVRAKAYNELEPDHKDEYLRDLREYTGRMIEHDSELREAIRRLAPRLFGGPFG